MKKILLSAAVLLASVVAANAQIGFKVDGNVGFSNFNGDNAKDTKMLIGYRVGATAEIPFAGEPMSGQFYFAPGLTAVSKGAKIETSVVGATSTATTRLHYLQVPLQLGARFQFADNMSVALQFGPYLSYGLSGNMALKTTVLGVDKTVESDPFKPVGNLKAGMKRFDAGATIQAAIEFSNFYAQVGTDFGLVNIANVDKGSLKNADFFVGLGYRF